MLKIVEHFMAKYPRVVLRVDAVSNPQSFPGLQDRRYDLFLTMLPLPERRVPEFANVEVLFSDPLVVAAGPNRRWLSRRKIDFAELCNETWILTTADSWNYICVSDAFRARGLPAPKVGLWTNIALLRNALMAEGQFVTALPASNAKSYGMKALSVDLPVGPWPVVIATLKGRTLSSVVGLFVEFVREFTKPTRKVDAAHFLDGMPPNNRQ